MLEGVTKSIDNAVNKLTDPKQGFVVQVTLEDSIYVKLGLAIVGAAVLSYTLVLVMRKIIA